MEQPLPRTVAGGRARGWVHTHGPSLIELFRILDAAVLVASLWAVCWWFGLAWNRDGALAAVLGVAFFFLAATHLRLYRSWRISPLRDELGRLLLCCIAAYLGLVATFQGLVFWPDLPRMVLPAWALAAAILLGTGRVVVRSALRIVRIRGGNFRTAAIVGANDTAQRIAEQLQNSAWMGMRVLGIFDDEPDPGVPANGGLQSLHALVAAGEVDTVYITLPLGDQPVIRALLAVMRDSAVTVSYVVDVSEFGPSLSPRWEVVGGMPTVSLIDNPQQGVHGLAKRIFDAVLSGTALVLLAPLLLLIAAAIKLTSPGPAVFAQRRHGQAGREFTIYKFRTMTVVEDGKTAFRQASRGDARITRLGAFLRRTSLDELPQLVNVLLGHMSLVGPRPHPVALNEAQRKQIEGYMLRHKVKPGVTGWAQINGFRGETDTPEKMEGRVRYDLEYINSWSLWLDVRILWLTLFRIIGDRNAH